MKKKIIVIIIFSLTIILFILYAIFNPFLTIKLNGKNTYQIKLGEIYKENGCKAKGLFLDLSNNVKIKGKVNNKKIGTYKLEYKIKYLFKSKKIYRTISVIDTEGPVITLIGDENIEIYVGDIYQELGFNVSDNYDKELEDAVKIDSNLDNTKAGDYQIKYSVEDSSGNKVEVVRNIKVKEKIVKAAEKINTMKIEIEKDNVVITDEMLDELKELLQFLQDSKDTLEVDVERTLAEIEKILDLIATKGMQLEQYDKLIEKQNEVIVKMKNVMQTVEKI